MQHPFRLSILALSLGLAPALAMADGAATPPQSTADILKQIEALKTQVQDLEAKVQAQQQQIDDTQATANDASASADRNDVQVTGIKGAVEKSGLKGLTITGMIAPAYVYNQAQQSSSFVFLNRSNGSAGGSTIYNYDNSSFGQVDIQFQKVMDDGTKWTLNLAPDRGTGAEFNGSSIINEASVSMPIGQDQNTRLIAGQIPDWEGYEYVFDNQTKSITHNLLFDFTELYAYTGVGLDVTRDAWEWKALVGNMNAARYYTNSQGGTAPALVVRADYAPAGYDNADIGGWALVGKTPNVATAAATGNLLNANGVSSTAMAELDAYMTHGDWGYYGQVGVGEQANASYNASNYGDGSAARWWGLSGELTYNFTPRVLGFGRVDYLNDSANGGGLIGGYNGVDSTNGFGPDQTTCGAGTCTGNGANRYALTLGMNYAYSQSTTLKLEYRHDHSSYDNFLYVNDQSYKNYNNLLAASVVVSF